MKSLIFILCLLDPGLFGQNNAFSLNLETSPQILEEAGFKSKSIDQLISDINASARKDFRGIVVIKDNQLVIEAYFSTYWRKTIHDIRSAGKSVTALLLGIALNEGLVKDLDQDMYSLFPQFKVNEGYKKITLRHVLDMSSGLDADSDDSQSFGNAANWMALDDWKPFLLNVPLKQKPGKHFVYADINALLIGMAIEEASGLSLKDYAKQKLFDPLGITDFYWYTNPTNQTGAAGNLYLSTLDFAKLGVVIVNKGKWGGNQLIQPNYIEALQNTKSFEISDYFSLADSYGFLWYKSKRTFGKNTFNYLFASGNGGNHLVVIPSENMVIALTSSAYGPGYGQGRSFEILKRMLEAYNPNISSEPKSKTNEP